MASEGSNNLHAKQSISKIRGPVLDLGKSPPARKSKASREFRRYQPPGHPEPRILALRLFFLEINQPHRVSDRFGTQLLARRPSTIPVTPVATRHEERP